jgi:hypothetical protein
MNISQCPFSLAMANGLSSFGALRILFELLKKYVESVAYCRFAKCRFTVSSALTENINFGLKKALNYSEVF